MAEWPFFTSRTWIHIQHVGLGSQAFNCPFLNEAPLKKKESSGKLSFPGGWRHWHGLTKPVQIKWQPAEPIRGKKSITSLWGSEVGTRSEQSILSSLKKSFGKLFFFNIWAVLISTIHSFGPWCYQLPLYNMDLKYLPHCLASWRHPFCTSKSVKSSTKNSANWPLSFKSSASKTPQVSAGFMYWRVFYFALDLQFSHCLIFVWRQTL